MLGNESFTKGSRAMRLLHFPISPFARKVRMALIERELESQVVLESINPLSDDVERLEERNPLGQVPVLILDNGESLYDSLVICEYLDGLGAAPPLFPPTPDLRIAALTRHALANGVMGAAVALAMEGRRPQEQQSRDWSARWQRAIVRSVLAMNSDISYDRMDIGDIATLAALCFIDLRFADIEWRHSSPELASWFGKQSHRKSVLETAPVQL